jgi:hypothetical protein
MEQKVSNTAVRIGHNSITKAHRLYHDDSCQDLVIILSKETIKVHKAILCSRSDFFRVACKKSTFKEGEESVIDLSADDEDPIGNHPSPVRLMIEYFCTLDYEVYLPCSVWTKDTDG